MTIVLHLIKNMISIHEPEYLGVYMNERIRELAEQAWDETKEEFGSFVDDSGEIDFTFLHAYTEKLAELIVLEVLAVQENLISNGHNAWHLHKPTKKHFGIRL